MLVGGHHSKGEPQQKNDVLDSLRLKGRFEPHLNRESMEVKGQ
jgi:hypothetical protein